MVFQWNPDFFWHIGPFNYCTCGHCGWDGIVCLSVGSVVSFHSFVSSFHFLYLNLHCQIGIALLVHWLSVWFMHYFICVCVSDNWVSLITKLNCQIASHYTKSNQTIIFWYINQFFLFFHSNHNFSCCYGNHINLLPLATSGSLSYSFHGYNLCLLPLATRNFWFMHSDGHFCFLSYRLFLFYIHLNWPVMGTDLCSLCLFAYLLIWFITLDL